MLPVVVVVTVVSGVLAAAVYPPTAANSQTASAVHLGKGSRQRDAAGWLGPGNVRDLQNILHGVGFINAGLPVSERDGVPAGTLPLGLLVLASTAQRRPLLNDNGMAFLGGRVGEWARVRVAGVGYCGKRTNRRVLFAPGVDVMHELASASGMVAIVPSRISLGAIQRAECAHTLGDEAQKSCSPPAPSSLWPSSHAGIRTRRRGNSATRKKP